MIAFLRALTKWHIFFNIWVTQYVNFYNKVKLYKTLLFKVAGWWQLLMIIVKVDKWWLNLSNLGTLVNLGLKFSSLSGFNDISGGLRQTAHQLNTPNVCYHFRVPRYLRIDIKDKNSWPKARLPCKSIRNMYIKLFIYIL